MNIRAATPNSLACMCLCRLPFFLFINAALNIFAYISGDTYGYAGIALLLLIPFAINVLIGATATKGIQAVYALALTALSVPAVYFFAAGMYLKNGMLVSLGVLTVYTLLIDAGTYSRKRFAAWSIVLGLLYTFCVLLEARTLCRALLAYILLILSLDLVCSVLNRMESMIHSRRLGGTPRRTLLALTSHNYKWLTALLLVMGTICFAAMLPEYPTVKLNISPITPLPQTTPMPIENFPTAGENSAILPTPPERPEFTQEDMENDPVNKFISRAPVLLLPVLVIILLTVRRLRKLYGKSGDIPHDEETQEVVTEEYEESAGNGKRRSAIINRSVNETIRKIFFKKVREHKKKHQLTVLAKYTARDITKVISQTENITLLGDIYETARYSGQIMTKDELNAYYNTVRKKR